MSYSINVIKTENPLFLQFNLPISIEETNLINIISKNLPYHIKHTSWNNSKNTFYFLDIPNNKYSDYFKNYELFYRDYLSLKKNNVSFSGITEHSNFKRMIPFFKDIFPNLEIHHYFVLSLISQNFIDCSFSINNNNVYFLPSEGFIKDFGFQQIIFIQQLFFSDTCDFFNSFFKTSIQKNIVSGNMTINYESENQFNILYLSLSDKNLEIKNFNSNINQFNIQKIYKLNEIKEKTFLGIPSSFIKVIQFLELNDKLNNNLQSPLYKPKHKNKI
jgi:hypothetical protein